MGRKVKWAAALLGIALFSGALHAGDPESALDSALESLSPEAWIARSFTDRDVSLLFGFLRQSLAASMAGDTPPAPPEELRQRADELSRSFQKEGTAVAGTVLDAAEAELRRMLKELRQDD